MAFALIQRFFQRFKRPSPLATSEDATRVFLELFKGHDLPCHLENGWIVADSGCLQARAEISHGLTTPKFSIQLDVDVVFPSGETISEACAGFGSTLHDAIGDSIVNFCNGPFHVILSAATGQICSHCDSEEWEFDGKFRRVLISPVVTRGLDVERQSLTVEWFSWVASEIQQNSLTDEMHWFRFFHGQYPNGAQSEVLFNNIPSAGSQQALEEYPWPVAEGYYSVRVFVVVLAVAG